MYTADALANEVRRGTSRSAFHSISISGRDPLSNVEYHLRRVRQGVDDDSGDARHRRTASGRDRGAEIIRHA